MLPSMQLTHNFIQKSLYCISVKVHNLNTKYTYFIYISENDFHNLRCGPTFQGIGNKKMNYQGGRLQ